MRVTTIPESGAKRRLLEVAEKLFAERGFDNVSLRDITKAGDANVAAVNYHFGSREALLHLVILRYIQPINQERIARLDSIEQKWNGKPLPVEEIIDAFARPLVTQVKKTDLSEKLFCKLIGRIFSENSVALAPELAEPVLQVFERFHRAFQKALPTVSPEDLAWRMLMLTGAMVHLMGHQEMMMQLGQGLTTRPTLEQTLARFIRFASSGMREGSPQDVSPRGPQAIFDF